MIMPSRIASTPYAISEHARTIMIDSALTIGDAHIKSDNAIKIRPSMSINHQPLTFAPPSQNDILTRDSPVMNSHKPITNGRMNDVMPGLAIINTPAIMSRSPDRMNLLNLKK